MPAVALASACTPHPPLLTPRFPVLLLLPLRSPSHPAYLRGRKSFAHRFSLPCHRSQSPFPAPQSAAPAAPPPQDRGSTHLQTCANATSHPPRTAGPQTPPRPLQIPPRDKHPASATRPTPPAPHHASSDRRPP